MIHRCRALRPILLDAPDPNAIKRGMRVRVVFEEERQGRIEDIKHFEIVA